MHPIEAFRNPASRPRAFIWTGALILAILIVVTVAVGATSTYWFCASVCHKVQDDTIAAYQNSSHDRVSCISCHEPVNANPIVFLYKKAEAGIGELPMTIGNSYELPLNGEDRVALSSEEFPDEQCTQCHTEKRLGTDSDNDIIFNHTTHTNMGVRCTMCHNRIAHNEDGIALTTKNPKTGEMGHYHNDYSTMTGCYRCHSLEPDAVASGECSVCHVNTSTENLLPADHKEADFMASHAKLYFDQEHKVEEGIKETGEQAPTGASVKAHLADLANGVSTGKASSNDFKYPIAPIETINECYTCHTVDSCTACHAQKGITVTLK